jgi:hypothetical protein
MNEPIINRPTRFAPPPQRRLTLTAQNHLENAQALPSPMTPSSPPASPMGQMAPEPHRLDALPTGSIGPNNVPGRTFAEGGAPADPQSAAQIAELLKQNGDLVRALGDRDKKFELRMKQMQFDVQTQLAARDGAPVPQLPAGVPTDAPVTTGQLLTVLTQHGMAMEAHNIRQNWDVTPNEEATALQRNPMIAGLSEPRRTAMIREAVSLLREEAGPAPTGTEAPAPPANPTRRPAQQVVAAPELTRSAGSATEDTGGQSELQTAQTNYERAKGLVDPKQRLETMKALYERILALQGMNSDDVLKKSFVMG